MITARTSSRLAAARAASASSLVSLSFSALTGGRFSRRGQIPPATPSVTNSPMSILLAQIAVGHAGRRLRVRDQPELGAAVEQRVVRQHPHRVAERPGLIQRHLTGVPHPPGGYGGAGSPPVI